MTESPWIMHHRRSPGARTRLIAFPFAGGGASAFRHWPNFLPAGIDVTAVQLPGRENRIAEAPMTDMGEILNEISRAILGCQDQPFALFGHSLGALLAFETARQLRRMNAPLPIHLFLSARPAAHLNGARKALRRLSDADLTEELHHIGGTPAEVLEDAHLRNLLLPSIRADFELHERYRYVPEPPLDIACSILGAADDALCRKEDLAAWRTLTRQDATVTMFAGGHFFIRSCPATIAELILTRLES